MGAPGEKKKTKPNVPTVAPIGRNKKCEHFSSPEKIVNPSVPKDEVAWLVVYVLQRVSNNWIRNFIKSVTEFLPNSRFLSCRFKS